MKKEFSSGNLISVSICMSYCEYEDDENVEGKCLGILEFLFTIIMACLPIIDITWKRYFTCRATFCICSTLTYLNALRNSFHSRRQMPRS